MTGPGTASARPAASRLTVVLVVVLVVLTVASGVVWWNVWTASSAVPGPAAPPSGTSSSGTSSPPTASGTPGAAPEDDLPRSAQPLAEDQIVWRHNIGTDWTMSTIGSDGARSSVVLASGEQEVAPVVSHDRRTVLYLRRERPGDRSSLHAVAADGSAQRLLFRDGSSSCPFLRQVVWNVDGTLGVVCKLDKEGTAYTLATAALDGTFLRTLDVGVIGSPTLSPDGRQILYPKSSSGSYKRGGSLYVTDVDGSTEPTKVVGGRDVGPAWAPDGKSIAFARYDGDDTHIVTMPVGGSASDIDVLTSRHETALDPSWSPDGDALVYRRGPDDDHLRLTVMTRKGKERRDLSHDGTVGSPCWTPR